MRKLMLVVLTLSVFLLGAPALFAELRIYDKPDGIPVEKKDYYERFTLENSLRRLEQIRGALMSFNRLTEKVKGDTLLSDERLEEIGNTSWEVQSIGFPNFANAVEGTLRRYHYELKQAEFELATIRSEQGVVNEEALKKSQQAFQDAEKGMQKFWDEFQIAD